MQDKINLNLPKVSIGIPTYNRVGLLKCSVESALNQDYPNIEILISDNASTDATSDICRFYCENYGSLIKYFRQAVNRGATANFSKVLEMASGDFFMWLGDDDWIDISYVRHCVQQLISNPTVSLVSGTPQYYRNGRQVFEGKRLSLLYESWWLRVVVYYTKVADNGMFYGLMRTSQIRQINILNTMGGDRHLIAGLASLGKIKMISEIRVHRALGGATLSYHKIAHSMGLPKIQALFPMLSIAESAWVDIVIKGATYQSKLIFVRLLIGMTVVGVILLKRSLGYLKEIAVFLIKSI